MSIVYGFMRHWATLIWMNGAPALMLYSDFIHWIHAKNCSGIITAFIWVMSAQVRLKRDTLLISMHCAEIMGDWFWAGLAHLGRPNLLWHRILSILDTSEITNNESPNKKYKHWHTQWNKTHSGNGEMNWDRLHRLQNHGSKPELWNLLLFVLLLTGDQCLACSRPPGLHHLWLSSPIVASAMWARCQNELKANLALPLGFCSPSAEQCVPQRRTD